jgi:hypothetical protein
MNAIRAEFRALTLACVPGAATLDAKGWGEAEAIVDDALAERPAAVRRQVVFFVHALELLSRVRFGRGLARLGPERTRRLLGWLERSPLLLLRRGTWGIRTLCFMGVYGQAEVRRELGYAPSLRGWEGRGITPRPWPERGGAAPPEEGVLTAATAQPPGGPASGEAPHA